MWTELDYKDACFTNIDLVSATNLCMLTSTGLVAKIGYSSITAATLFLEGKPALRLLNVVSIASFS